MNAPKYMKKDFDWTISQKVLIEDYIKNQTGNVAMLVSIKWKKPYIKSDVSIRGNVEYQSLNPDLKDIVQQLSIVVVKELKKKYASGLLLTMYPCAPTEGQADARGMMAFHRKFDERAQEDDYWVTFGDTGKDVFTTIVNSYGAEVGVGALLESK